jgi:hypothetical protein
MDQTLIDQFRNSKRGNARVYVEYSRLQQCLNKTYFEELVSPLKSFLAEQDARKKGEQKINESI